MKNTQKIVDSTSVKSMDEFQKRYFPKDVGKKCAHCGAKIKDGRSIEERKNALYPSLDLP